ncbi:ABC transporter substrate-binding protein [Frankia sp. AgB32]|uniref:ABC transporter substrate-binding protein n=1 Tax=Frankia sp. AgB32 TaxID=631119 RepID=UPI00200E763F|nr:ABC transporter substrate-binding protein [Frankia sp. AgB32]MCK9896567.1 ABC transporter substrate-binding protein [Frankia sp. AgB32]
MVRSFRAGGWQHAAAGDNNDAASGVGGLAPAAGGTGPGSVSRRTLLRWGGTAAVAAPAAGLLAACGGSSGSAGPRTVRIGYVVPRTGTLGLYSIVESYVIQMMRTMFADGIKVGGRTYPVEIVVRDSQSDRLRAGVAAADLVFKDKVDLVLVGGTSDTAIPVSDQCEINEVPCISTLTPWQSWWDGRGGNVDMPFHWTYHLSWGMEDIVNDAVSMWKQLNITKVGLVYSNDDDGRAFANRDYGIPTISNYGFQVISPATEGFEPGIASFDDYVNKFRSEDVGAIVGVAQAADFAVLQRSIHGAGSFTPKALTMSKALDHQTDLRTLGSNGDGLTTEIGWSPSHPYRSSLNGKTSKDLADAFAKDRGRAWTTGLGFGYALFEVAVKALSGAASLEKEDIASAIRAVDAQTIVGPVAFGSQQNVPKNVARIPVVGGQWDQVNNDFNLQIVNNSGNTKVPVGGQLRPLPPPT